MEPLRHPLPHRDTGGSREEPFKQCSVEGEYVIRGDANSRHLVGVYVFQKDDVGCC